MPTAPTIVNRAEVVNNNTITKPAGGTTGDFYVVAIYTESAASPPAVLLSGFTATGFVTQFDANTSITATTNVFWRAYDGTEGATFTVSGTGAFACITAMIVRGAVGTPLSNANQSVNSGGSLSVSGVTTTVANALGIVLSHSVTSDTQSMPGSWTQLVAWDSGTAATYSQVFTAVGATGSWTLTYHETAPTASSMAVGIIAFQPPNDAYPGVVFRRRFQKINKGL